MNKGLNHKRDTFVIVGGRLLQTAIMVLTIYILTNILSPVELGKYYLFMSLVAFSGLVLINPFGRFIQRKVNAWNSSKLLFQRLYEYNFYVFFVCVISIFLLILFTNMGFFSSLQDFSFLWIFGLFIYFNTWANTLVPVFNMLFFRITFVILTVLTSVFLLIMPYLFAVNNGSVQSWMIGTVLSYAAISFIAGVIFLRVYVRDGLSSIIPKYRLSKIKKLATFIVPLGVATLFMWAQSSGLRILVEHFYTLEYLAFLGVGLALASQITVTVEGIITQIYHPIYYARLESEDIAVRAESLNRTLELVIPVYLLMFIYVIVFSKEIFIILINEQYHNAYTFLMIGMIFEFFRMLTNLYSNAFHSEMATKNLMLPYFIGVVFTVLAIFIGLRFNEFHFYLIPLVWAVGMLVTFIIMTRLAKKLLTVIFPWVGSFKILLFSVPIVVWGCLGKSDTTDLVYVIMVLILSGLYCVAALYFILRPALLDARVAKRDALV